MRINDIEDVMLSLSETDELIETLEMMKYHRIGDGELNAPFHAVSQTILEKFENDTDPINEKPSDLKFWMWFNLKIWIQTRKGKKWAVKKFGKNAVRRIFKNDSASLVFKSDDDIVYFAARCIMQMEGLEGDDTQSLAA